MSLQAMTLQTAREFLDGTRTTFGGDLSSVFGENVLTIIALIITGFVVIGFIMFMKGMSLKYTFPEGRRVGRIRFIGLDGKEFFANVSENDTFKNTDLEELIEKGYVETSMDVIERLQREGGFKVYNAKIFKYGHGTRWRANQKDIQLHTRVSLEDVNYFTTAEKTTRSWYSILEPEVTKNIYLHGESKLNDYKTYNGKKRDVFSMGIIPTNPKVRYAQISDIFGDRHTSIPMEIKTIDSITSKTLGSMIEWTPKVAYLERELKAKENTLKDFDKLLDDKSKRLGTFNIVINKLRGALEMKKLTGTDAKRDPIKIGSNILLGIISVFIGGVAYAGWLGVDELGSYSPWFGIIIASALMAVLIHASETRKKEEYEKAQVDVDV